MLLPRGNADSSPSIGGYERRSRRVMNLPTPATKHDTYCCCRGYSSHSRCRFCNGQCLLLVHLLLSEARIHNSTKDSAIKAECDVPTLAFNRTTKGCRAQNCTFWLAGGRANDSDDRPLVPEFQITDECIMRSHLSI
jgi:hypothetical protein